MTQRFTVSRLSVAVVLVLTLFLAAIPQPAQAATCRTYHYVREGDTIVSIAKTYGLKWREIADANNLDYPYDLDVGDRLCIPPKDTDDDDDDENTDDDVEFRYSVSATHSAISITVSGLNIKKAAFNVRVRNASTGVGGWVKLGRLKAEKKETTKMVFSVPAEFRSTLYLSVCLKNLTTDELTCKTVIHP
jgi:LysM repeat protein